MSQAISRGLRTFLWAFLGALMSSGIFSAAAESGIVDWAVLKKAIFSALAAGLAGLISYLYNALEDANVAPKLLGKR